MNFSCLVLFIGLLVAVELTEFSWASHEKLEIQGGSQQEGYARRSVIGNPCFTQFSLGGQPPIFPTANTAPICQTQDGSNTALGVQFGTLFDTSLGIPRYSIYALHPAQVNNIDTVQRTDSWHKTKGITLEGNNAMYNKQNYHKGHVAPFKILSYSGASGKASFAYTNAVPQVPNFNMGSWRQYESRIVKYAETNCAPQGGTIYLITGISEVAINQVPSGQVQATKQPMPTSFPPGFPQIAIPNSMWTAGCCVKAGNVLGAFAVIGNNLPKGSNTVSSLSVDEVQNFIRTGANDPSIELFPGSPGTGLPGTGCSNPAIQVTL